MSGMETTSDATPAARSASLAPTALIGAVFLIVAIVFLSTSSWYVAFLAIHVTFVVIWLGGGVMLTIFGLLAERARDGAQLQQIARMAAFAGERIFAPSALVVVAMGFAMVVNGNLKFGQFWLLFGLLGFLTTFVLGIGVLGPMSKRVAAIVAEKGVDHPDALAAVSRILLIARADVALLLLVVVDMVARPFS